MALNQAAFEAAQRRTEEAGRRGDWANAQISPWEWQQLGGNPSEYKDLYGPSAFYNNDGSLTGQGQSYGVQPAQAPNDFRATDPVTGAPIQPVTGVHMSPGGYAVPPYTDTSSASGLISGQSDYARLNMEQQIGANRFDQNTAYGSSRWERDPQTGQMINVQELDPWSQRIREQNQGQDYYIGETAKGNIDKIASQGDYSFKGIPEMMSQDQLANERSNVENKLYDSYARRMEPRFAREKENLNQRIADMGMPLNSEKAKELQDQQAYDQNQAYLDASAKATEMGGSEMERTFGYSKDIRNMGINEYTAQYNKPYENYSNLRGMQGAIEQPKFADPTKIDVPTVDAAAIAGNWRGQDLANEMNQRDNDTRLAVANIGAASGGSEGGFQDIIVNIPDTPASKSMYGNQQQQSQQQQPSGQNVMGNTSGQPLNTIGNVTNNRAKTLQSSGGSAKTGQGFGGIPQQNYAQRYNMY